MPWAQQTSSHLMAFPELVEGFQVLNLMTKHSSVEPVEYTPPLLNDSSLIFLTTARTYAKPHDILVWQPYA